MRTGDAAAGEAAAWRILATIADPEIPVISIVELGIVRGVARSSQGVRVRITPTYSGCPAMDVIEEDIRAAFAREGHEAEVERVLSPAWTTDGIAPEGREKLAAFGIAPPSLRRIGDGGAGGPDHARAGTATIDVSRLVSRRGGTPAAAVACPQCASPRTTRLAQFASTACKALYRCDDCGEPFDHFKSHR